ncbi:hypothetical protein ACQPU1_09980 [Clostridium paraputrificum]|uniref:hypothetical protein n=1 Tax=Clostridium paraputrificum TaxID=29363 RepID=UPI003D3269E9
MNIEIKNKSYSFNIDKIAEYLFPFKDKLHELYTWETPTDEELKTGLKLNLFTKTEYNKLLKTQNYFDRNSLMKNFIHNKISKTKNKEVLTSYYIWIIKDWGGIRGIKSEGLYERIHKSQDSYKEDCSISFDKISSTTKALHFISPSEFIIYDSRVAYALNWILLKTEASKNFFIIPQGRNSKLSAFDMPTLIRLKNMNIYKSSYEDNNYDKRFIYNNDKNLFINEKYCYYLMNEILKEISKRLWAGSKMANYPYYTEMLLFSIADTFIFEDILHTLSL